MKNKFKKELDKLIYQGSGYKILGVHQMIYARHKEVFHEDNYPTLIDYILENTLKSFCDDMRRDIPYYRKICLNPINRLFDQLERQGDKND